MIELTPFIVAAKAVAVAVGCGITLFTYRASRRTGSVALRTLAVGAALVTASVAVGGGLDRLLGVGLETGVLLSSALSVAGFLTLAYSLYVTDPTLGGEARLPSRDGGHGD
jgi:hypothetical protein